MQDIPDLKPVTRSLTVPETLTKRLYSIPELMRLTGMSRKQVGYWAKIDLIQPTIRIPNAGTGRPASFFSAVSVIKALIVCELRRDGLSLRQIQKVASNLQQQGIELHESEAYLLTDGYSVYYAFSEREVVDIHKNHHQMLLLVPIHEQVAKLQEVA